MARGFLEMALRSASVALAASVANKIENPVLLSDVMDDLDSAIEAASGPDSGLKITTLTVEGRYQSQLIQVKSGEDWVSLEDLCDAIHSEEYRCTYKIRTKSADVLVIKITVAWG